MKSWPLLLGALLVGALLVARLARDEPTAEFAALEPGAAATASEVHEQETAVEPRLPDARVPLSDPSARTPEEVEDAAPIGAPAADAEPDRLDLLVVHARTGDEEIPLPGVRVLVVDDAALPTAQRVLLGTTGADGHLLTVMPTSELSRLVADPATLPVGVGSVGVLEVPPSAKDRTRTFGTLHVGEPAPEPDGPVERILKLPSAGTLVVTAHRADGAPVQDAIVEVWWLGQPGRHASKLSPLRRTTRTDEEGVAVLESLRAGELLVEVDARRSSAGASGAPVTTAGPQRVRLLPAARAQLTFELGSAHHVLRGRVIDDAGAPVQGVAVDARYDHRAPGAPLPRRAHDLRPPARAATTTTDEAGRFQLEGLGPGPYLLFLDLGPSIARLDERRLLPTPVVVREVDAGAGSTLVHAADDVVVPSLQLFVVRGRVVLDEDLLGAGELTLRDLRPQIGDDLPVERARCDYDARTGAFEVVCRLPLERLTLVVEPRRFGAEPSHYPRSRRQVAPGSVFESARTREYPFVPESGLVLEDVELRYP